MTVTIAFDVYGTLIDTNGVELALRDRVGTAAGEFSRLWRAKQLEYAFRRGLMRSYVDFDQCTRQALDYCCAALGADLSVDDRQALMDSYRVLPAFGDVADGLAAVNERGHRLYAFSNGRKDAVESLLRHAGIDGYFRAVVSVDDIKSYKPDPAVYRHFLLRSGALEGAAWLVSSNPFDVIGALSAGMEAAWVRRSAESVFDPWELQPTATISGLSELAAILPDPDTGTDTGNAGS
ncbi:MAG TPA: haloacid dehalogenase type II [Gammaproteobacteria bacterium]|nr:haloacid dehalogenase type II [Gammaproteobacteria bacterium]